MVLDKVSDAPFCATVKSALPTEMMAAADCSRPLLVTSRVTTAITAMATAKARPIERAFFLHRLRRMRSKKVIRRPSEGIRFVSCTGSCPQLGSGRLPLAVVIDHCPRLGRGALGTFGLNSVMRELDAARSFCPSRPQSVNCRRSPGESSTTSPSRPTRTAPSPESETSTVN